mmetsp:Transcript_21465/g.32755  ORF Transcript_21465/g.32755 Transcript_21465/m.32755 type:complete len:209 (+) Transcript_21465:155-781(+)
MQLLRTKCLFGPEHILNNLTSVVHVIKSEGEEVVEGIRASVDLDTSKNGNAPLDSKRTLLDDLTHEQVLRVIKSQRKLNHAVLSLCKTLSVRKDKLLHNTLLKVSELLDVDADGETSLSNTLHIVRGCDGASTAAINKVNSSTLDLTNGTIGSDTNVGSINDQAVSIIGNVGGHGTETGVSSKGETSKTSQVEILTEDTDEIALQLTS